MSKTYRFFLLVLGLLPLVSWGIPPDSCRYQLRGVVLDAESGEGVAYAEVSLQGLGLHTVSDAEGRFVFAHLCTKACTLVCTHLGYKPSEKIAHPMRDSLVYIRLSTQTTELETVHISAELLRPDESFVALEIGREQLVAARMLSLGESLARLSGISVASAGNNVQLPIIHGLSGNRILVINNGVKHGFQNWGNDHAPEIDIQTAERVRVIKGAAGVRYGPEALGGVIAVEPREMPLHTPLRGSLSAGYQTNGRGFDQSFDLAAGYSRWAWRIEGGFNKIGDRHTPDYLLTNSGKREQSLGASLRYQNKPKTTGFRADYSYLSQNLGLLRASVAESADLFVRALAAEQPIIIAPFSYAIGQPNQETRHQLLKLEVDHRNALGQWLFRVSHQDNQRKEYDVRRNAERPIINLDLQTTDVQAEWQTHHLGTFGGQYFHQKNRNNPGTGVTPFVPNYTLDRGSLFWTATHDHDRHSYEWGARLDWESTRATGRQPNQDIFRRNYTFANFTAALGWVYRLRPTLTLRQHLGSAWRTPNVAELFSFGQHGFKTVFGLWRHETLPDGQLSTDRVLGPNDAPLRPERGYKYTATLEQQRFSLTAYANYVEAFVFEKPAAVVGTIRGPMPVFFYDQSDALFLGLDADYTQTLQKNLQLTYTLSYLWSRNVSRRESLINQPPIRIDTELRWTLPLLDQTTLRLQAGYTFRQFQAPPTVTIPDLISGGVAIGTDTPIFDFREAPDGYLLVHLHWRSQWKHWTVQASLRNALHTRYRDYLNQMRYFADEMGRNLSLALFYQFNT
ncbi:MAG: TonB-dependent receptor [Bernardetiaceae bacterium]